MNNKTYNEYSEDEKVDICQEFKEKYYSGESIFILAYTFSVINPTVTKTENGYDIWNAHRAKFEQLLNLK